jgi:hypothetical protein
VGKDGDLALFSDHPLSVYTVPLKTWVDGIKYFDHDEDPDDMRLRVSPTAELDTFIEQGTGRHSDDEEVSFDELFGSE